MSKLKKLSSVDLATISDDFGEILEIEGRRWVQAINAKGQDGYVSADYVQLTD